MEESRKKLVQMVAGDGIFQSLAYGALKARAARLAPGEIIQSGGFELMVVEDENGEGIAVQIIETAECMDALIMARAEKAGISLDGWSDQERKEWMASFWSDLGRVLDQWQNIKIRPGPGENMTIEKAVSK
ncbi:Uncharacterised protein [uncultured archaeon]|nr:Uncharacterised protein [uncultured archaeon]